MNRLVHWLLVWTDNSMFAKLELNKYLILVIKLTNERMTGEPMTILLINELATNELLNIFE